MQWSFIRRFIQNGFQTFPPAWKPFYFKSKFDEIVNWFLKIRLFQITFDFHIILSQKLKAIQKAMENGK